MSLDDVAMLASLVALAVSVLVLLVSTWRWRP